MVFMPGLVGVNSAPVYDNDAYTKALLQFDGGFADVNVGGSAHVWQGFSGAKQNYSTKKFGDASLFCNNGYISTGDHADFDLGSGDWTIETWFNRNGDTNTAWLFGQSTTGGATGSTMAWGASIQTNSGGNANQIFFSVSNGSALTQLILSAVNDSSWHHCAFQRLGNTLYGFLDGVMVSSTAFSSTVNAVAANVSIGRNGDASGNNWRGYIDDFRLSVGIARHSISGFTPKASAFTSPPSFGNDRFTRILLQADVDFTDSALGPTSTTTWGNFSGTPTIVTGGSSKFGNGSLRCNGAALSASDRASFTLGPQDWTMDFWFNRRGNTTASQGVLGHAGSGGTQNQTQFGFLWSTSGNKLEAYVSDGTNWYTNQSVTAYTDSNWHHCALMRKQDTVYLFLDGVMEDSVAMTAAVFDSAGQFVLGSFGEFVSSYFAGDLDEIRLSIGIARFNTAGFTPPAAAYS